MRRDIIKWAISTAADLLRPSEQWMSVALPVDGGRDDVGRAQGGASGVGPSCVLEGVSIKFECYVWYVVGMRYAARGMRHAVRGQVFRGYRCSRNRPR